MKKLIIEDENEGLLKLIGKRVTLFCVRYIYTGDLVGVNDTCVLLENGGIVFDTGDFKEKELKKVSYLSGLKTTQPTLQLILQLKRIWMKKNKERDGKIKKLEKELNALKIQETIEECPICMDSLCKTNVCVTKCGHKYCSTCFVRSVMKKNSCPMCREKIVEEEHYVKDVRKIQSSSSYVYDEELIRAEFTLNLRHYNN